MPKPWAGYVRVSSVGGRGGDSFHSPTDQEQSIHVWAKAHRTRVTILPHELDESGGRADRPILATAIEGIERGDYQGLVVASLSRASRSTRHLLDMWDRIERAGGQVVAVAENIDTSTPAGRLTRTMLAAIAEHELDVHRERFEELRASATARGIWQRRQTPLGYSRGEDRRLAPNERAADVVSAYRARAAGENLTTIAQRIGMTTSGVRALLRNRVYLGELQVGKHVNPTAHPALVSDDDWHAAQTARSTRPTRSGRPPALLAGLVTCQSCGHRMTRAHGSYGCAVRHSAGRCPAPAMITAVALDEHVTRAALTELAKFTATAASDNTRTDEARDRLRGAERELAAYLEAVNAAGLDPGTYAAGARARQEAVTRARGDLDGLLAHRALPVSGDPVSLWDKLDERQRNHLLRSLFEAVVVVASGRGKRIPIHDRATILRTGSGIVTRYGGGGAAMPVEPVVIARDDPRVVGVDLSE